MKRSSVIGIVVLALVAGGAGAFLGRRPHARPAPEAPPPPAPSVAPTGKVVTEVFEDIGPRLISNQTAYPLYLYGRGFQAGDQAVFTGPFTLTLPTAFIDGSHLAVRLPAQAMNPRLEREEVTVHVVRGTHTLLGQAVLTLVNDDAFAEPSACALSPEGKSLWVVSPTTDELAHYDTSSGTRTAQRIGDGPRAVATAADGTVVVAEEWGHDLRLLTAPDLDGGAKVIALGEQPQDLLLEGRTAWVTTREGSLLRVNLDSQTIERHAVPGRQPRALARVPGGTVVAELGTDDVAFLPDDGGASVRIAPRPGTRIVGGSTQGMDPYVMGGKAPRALVWDAQDKVLFESSIGPNVGPNPKKVEVSMNSGVGVIPWPEKTFALHRGLGVGVLEEMALDSSRHVLWAADEGAGRVMAFDPRKLRSDPEKAVLAELKIEPAADAPLTRPKEDFGVQGRSGIEIHTGPRALCLDAKKGTLYVVNRLSGTVSVLDVTHPAAPRLTATWAGPEMWNQRERRLGDVLYNTDLGRSAMTCEACHHDGHTSGVLYEKTHPLRIYRASTLRNIRDSAPYFTPSSLPTLSVVAHDVLARNRFHNPDPTAGEIHALAEYQTDFAAPPNPYVGEDGAPKTDLVLPDGHHGNARHGMVLFESKAVGCSATVCHPSPVFTADENAVSRGHFQDVGTPVMLPLRTEFQEGISNGWPPPPLVGAWDVFPMLESGAGGLTVAPDGSVVPEQTFALRAVLERQGTRPHGHLEGLSPQDVDDLLAYLMSL